MMGPLNLQKFENDNFKEDIMIEKELRTKMIQKHDIEVNWEKAINFIPKKGELIVYDPDENYDYSRVKIGDGISTVNELHFIIAVDTSLTQSGQAADAKAVGNALEGKQPIGDYVLANKLPEVIDDALTQAKASGEFDGPQGQKGDPGEKGDKGDTGLAGYTPVKGTDYWTDTDKTDMLNDVLAALPTWNGGSY